MLTHGKKRVERINNVEVKRTNHRKKKMQIKIVCVESRKGRLLQMKESKNLSSIIRLFPTKAKMEFCSECLLLDFACCLYSAYDIFLNKGFFNKMHTASSIKIIK